MNIQQLVSQSKENPDILTIEATVVTGFEFLALDECREKCKPLLLIRAKGRIIFNVHSSEFSKVLTLRSVDHILLVVHTVNDLTFEEEKQKDLDLIKSLVEVVNWDISLKKWADITEFKGIMYPRIDNPLSCHEEDTKDNTDLETQSPETLLQNTSEFTNTNCVPLSANGSSVSEIPSDSNCDTNDSHDLKKMCNVTDEGINNEKVDDCIMAESNHSVCSDEIKSERNICLDDDQSNMHPQATNPNVICDDNGITQENNSTLPEQNKKNQRKRYKNYNRKKFDGRKPKGNITKQLKSLKVNDGILRFRATCNRVGDHHSFTSMEAACDFGGTLQDKFNWTVDLTQFDLNVILNIENKQGYVCLALTKESQHRRNITHFDNTTLRATICYNLVRLAEPTTGEIVIDPLCGGGSIPIEGALSFPNTYHICGDYSRKAVDRTLANISHINKTQRQLKVGAVSWNVESLPLRDQSVDVLVTDLPFGRRSGQRTDNLKLYNTVLLQLARVVKVGTGRACLLTYDKTSLVRALRAQNNYWREIRQFTINQGGLFSTVFLLLRKASDLLNTSTLQEVPPPSGQSSDDKCSNSPPQSENIS